MTNLLPDDSEAHQFATMLLAGLPAAEAIGYFLLGDEDPTQVAEILRRWTRSRKVKLATARLMGKAWHEMSADEQMQMGLKLHYAQLASMLVSRHYAEASPMDKSKMDSARTAIEAKLAGTAGKGDALARFFDDINAGRLKLAPAIPRVGTVN